MTQDKWTVLAHRRQPLPRQQSLNSNRLQPLNKLRHLAQSPSIASNCPPFASLELARGQKREGLNYSNTLHQMAAELGRPFNVASGCGFSDTEIIFDKYKFRHYETTGYLDPLTELRECRYDADTLRDRSHHHKRRLDLWALLMGPRIFIPRSSDGQPSHRKHWRGCRRHLDILAPHLESGGTNPAVA